MTFKFWILLCFLFLVHNLVDLINERYSINYKVVEKGDILLDSDNDTNYLLCIPFWKIKQLNSLPKKPEVRYVKVKEFLKYSIQSIEFNLKTSNLFKLDQCSIFNRHFCFLTTKNELEKDVPLNGFLRIYEYFKLFIYSKGNQPFFYDFAYYKNDRLYSIYIRSFKRKVYNENYLLNPSSCSNQKDQLKFNRFTCLNKCFIKFKFKTSLYDFENDEIFDLNEIIKEDKKLVQQIDLDKNDNLFNFDILKRLGINKSYENCLNECLENGCFWETFNTVKIQLINQQEGKDKIDLRPNIYVAYHSMDDFYFYLQFFGLLTLFTGTSFVTLLPGLITSAALKLKSNHFEYFKTTEQRAKFYKFYRRFNMIYPKFNFALIFFSFVFVLNQSLSIIDEFKSNSNYPNKTSIQNFSSQPFSIVICFPIENSYQDNQLFVGRNSYILRNYNFGFIQKTSRNLLYSEIKHIKIYSGSKLLNSSITVSDKVLFKNSSFNGHTFLSRCFRVEIEIEEIKYISMMPISYLEIKFIARYREVFVIDKNQNFTSNLVNFRGLFYIYKAIKKYSKTSKKWNCKNYLEESKGQCESRRHCIDKCINEKFLKKHSSISINSVVDTEDFASYLVEQGIQFSERKDKNIEKNCLTFFNQVDCNEIIFEESSELVSDEVTNMVRLKLNYINWSEQEFEYSSFKTFFDILSLESVFFGTGATGILVTFISFFKLIFKFKWYLFFDRFIFLICLIGFITHNVLTFKSIIKSDLLESEYFIKLDEYNLPNQIFCFPIVIETDKNHKMSGESLDELTEHLNFTSIFDKIIYNNKTHFTTLEIENHKSTKRSSSELELNHFYYLNMKCFQINLKVRFEEEDFIFLDDSNILQIHLNKNYPFKELIYFYKLTDSNLLEGGFLYRIGQYKQYFGIHYGYQLEFQNFQISREDNFELLKHPSSLFYEKIKINDKVDYLNKMKQNFIETCKLVTNELILDTNFSLEIENELFEQFYLQTQIVSNNSKFESLDFNLTLSNTFIRIYYVYSTDPDFAFSFSFLGRKVEITNQENYPKLVLSVLNSLSLWLDICVLDLFNYFSYLFVYFTYIFKTFKKLNYFYHLFIIFKHYLKLKL